MTNTLTKHVNIIEIVRTYQQTVRDIRAAFKQIHGAMGELNKSVIMEEHALLSIQLREGRHVSAMQWANPDDAITHLRRDVWHHLIQRMDLRRIMSIKRWTALCKRVADDEPPPIDVETVTAFATQHMDILDDMMTESVAEVFNFLRPSKRHDKYKTNSEFEIGSKVILTYLVEPLWSDCSRWRAVSATASQMMTAIENVFSMVAGNGFINKTHYSEFENAVRATTSNHTLTHLRSEAADLRSFVAAAALVDNLGTGCAPATAVRRKHKGPCGVVVGCAGRCVEPANTSRKAPGLVATGHRTRRHGRRDTARRKLGGRVEVTRSGMGAYVYHRSFRARKARQRRSK